ncbi:hypothetical protein GQ600_11991 [Phytophthora cactorum]|nr:hypothetical protein GQ600_11991 [Phytophthora cactorum]
MKLSSFHALLVAAASLVAHTTADFKVTPEPIVKAATSKHVNYVKQWTLSAGSNTNSIDSLDLSLAGNALPAGVIGYVNVSGDSRTVVNAVTVSKDVLDIDNDLDDLFDNDNDGGELNAVTDLKSQRSAQVVVEDGVLVKNGKRAELQIDATGSSAVYVSSPKTDVSVRQLSLETTGTASIEYNVNSLNVRSELHMDVQGSSSITVLSSTVKTAQLELETERSGTICISAAEVRATLPKIQGKNQISMPNAGETYGTTGTDVCEEATLPARKAAKITGASASITGLITDLDDDLDNDLDDINDSTEN